MVRLNKIPKEFGLKCELGMFDKTVDEFININYLQLQSANTLTLVVV